MFSTRQIGLISLYVFLFACLLVCCGWPCVVDHDSLTFHLNMNIEKEKKKKQQQVEVDSSFLLDCTFVS